MGRFAILLACAAALMPPPALADGTLARAAIDRSLYREGEVRRSESRYRGWLLTCDEIRKLGQKFCSMRTVARAADGTIVAAMTVSTDTAGRPAAILTLPFGTVLGAGIRLAEAGRSPAAAHRMRPDQCDEAGCQMVWPLDAEAIRGLRAGRAVELSFARRVAASFETLDLKPGSTAIAGTISADGFAEALAASMR